MTKSNSDSDRDFSGNQPKLARILELAPFQVALLDSQRRFKYVNQTFADFQGCGRESFVGKTLSQTSASFYEKISPLLDESLAGRQINKEIELFDENQKPRWFVLELTPDLDEQQKLSGVFCYLTEVTESKESERLANLIFAHAPAFISMIDLDLKFRFVNQSLLDSLGLPIEEVIGKPLKEVLNPQSFSVAEKHLLKALEGEESVYENTVTRQNGSELDLLVHLVPERSTSDEVTGICALMVDTSALTNAQRKLRHNELRIETAVVGSSVGIIEFDPERPDWVFAGHIESLLGLEPGSLKDSRKLARERIHPDDIGVNEEAKRLEEDGFDTNIEMRLKTASGDYRWFSVNSRFKTNDDGKSKRIIGTISDIDELKKAQLKAAEDVKRRDEFLAMLSHELRNPLAAITFSLDWLQANDDKTLDGKSEKLLDVISRQADHMSKLLQDLLDVTRVTQNRIDFHFDVHDLNQSIRDVVDSILPAITVKNQHLIVNLATEPLMVKGDVIRLKQALTNLLDNASKYTPDGGNIWLQTEEIGGRAVFSVRDSGFGIVKESLSSIFDLFYQAGQPEKTGGIGVGLYLVNQIVRAHSGSISATSEGPGEGSMFTICLPMTDDQIQTRKSSRPQVRFHGCRAIVVEDNADTRISLSRLLRQRGFDVTSFVDGESAAKLLDEMNFDIAIVDIGLPGKSGLELAHEIRQSKHLNRALLIALTGYNRPADRKRINAAGFDVHLVKPADFGELCETIAAKLPH